MSDDAKPKPGKFLFLIICDDAREELGGKWTLTGVYPYDIFVDTFPARLDKLIFRITVETGSTKTLFISLRTDDGKQKVGTSVDISRMADGVLSVNMDVRNIYFESEDAITLLLGFDGEPEPVTTRAIRKRFSEEEASISRD